MEDIPGTAFTLGALGQISGTLPAQHACMSVDERSACMQALADQQGEAARPEGQRAAQ